jgi:hypothetical protein
MCGFNIYDICPFSRGHICPFPEVKAERSIYFARPLAGSKTAHKTHGVHRVAAETRAASLTFLSLKAREFLEQPKAPKTE